MSFVIKEIDRSSWDAFVAGRDEANFLNSWQWGELYEKLGDKVYRIAVCDDEKVTGIATAIIKNARRGRYLEIPGGPLTDWANKQASAVLFKYLRQIANENHCGFIRIRPQLIDNEQSRSYLTAIGFKKAPMHLHAENTSVLNLLQDEDVLLNKMRRQTRYLIRQSAKQKIEVSSTSEVAEIKEFHKIQLDTANRQGFVPPSLNFLESLFESFGEEARIYKVKSEGRLLAMAVIIFHGKEADYYEGASTPEGRDLPGAHAIQWQAIKDAKVAGIERYNFWGTAPKGSKKHRYAGVTIFKRGFGGEDVAFVPAHDLPVNKPKYMVSWLIETIRKKKRGL